MKRHKESYGPSLTPAMKAKLEAEIKAFNQAKTKSLIEKEALSKPAVNAYQAWVDKHEGTEDSRANPDLLSDEESMQFNRPVKDPSIEKAKAELTELLSHRELQVWQYVMRDGFTVADAAQRLRLSSATASQYLSSAKAKVMKHFNK